MYLYTSLDQKSIFASSTTISVDFQSFLRYPDRREEGVTVQYSTQCESFWSYLFLLSFPLYLVYRFCLPVKKNGYTLYLQV